MSISNEVDLSLIANEFERIIGYDKVRIYVNSAEYLPDDKDKIIGTLQAMRVPFAISNVYAETLTLSIAFDSNINSETQKTEYLNDISKLIGTTNGVIKTIDISEPLTVINDGVQKITRDDIGLDKNVEIVYNNAENTATGFQKSGNGIKITDGDKLITLKYEAFFEYTSIGQDFVWRVYKNGIATNLSKSLFLSPIEGTLDFNAEFTSIEAKEGDVFTVEFEQESFYGTLLDLNIFNNKATATDLTVAEDYSYTSYLQSDLPADPSRIQQGNFKGVYTVTGSMLITRAMGGLIISNNIVAELEVDGVSGVLKTLNNTTALSKEVESPNSLGDTKTKAFANNQTNSFQLQFVYEDSPICHKLIQVINTNSGELPNDIVKYKKTYPNGLIVERDCIIAEAQEIIQAGAYVTMSLVLMVVSPLIIQAKQNTKKQETLIVENK